MCSSAALGALRDHTPRIAEGTWRWVVIGDGPYRHALESAISRAGICEVGAAARTRQRTRSPRVVRGGRSVRAPVALRRQFAGHARGDGPQTPGDRHDRRGAARQSATGRQRMAGAPGDASALAAAISGALGQTDRFAGAWAKPAAKSSRASFRGRPPGADLLRLYDELLG